MPHRLVTLLMCGLAASNATAAAPIPTATPWVEIDGHRFAVEVARDDEQRSRGLMFRDQLAADAGMLFLFDAEQPLAFWMKNTRIALDILYFDRTGELVSLQADTPPCRTLQCPVFPSDRPAQYVVELQAGTAARLGIAHGAALCWDAVLGEPLPACASRQAK